MALAPEDDVMFQWPPPHWNIAAPEYGHTVPIVGPGAPAPPPPPPPPPPTQIAETAMPPALPPIGPPPLAVVPPPVETTPIDIPQVDLPLHEPEAASAMVPPVEEAPPVEVPLPEQPEQQDVYFDPLAPQTWDNPLAAGDLYDLAKRDPVAYAQHIAAMDQSRGDEQRARETSAARQNAVREEQNYQDLMDSMAKANEMRDRLLEQKVEANRWHKSRTPLQAIAGFLSVVIGGLYQARKGGPNIGLEIIDRAIDRDIAEQQANIADQRNAIADLRAQGMNDFQAKQAYRIAWYQRAREDVLTSMQDYDPAGTTARNLAQQAIEIETRIAQAAEAGRRSKLDEELKLRKDARDTAETMAKLREPDAKYAKAVGAGGGAVGVVKPGNLSAEQVRVMIGDPSVPVPDRPGGYTPAQAKQVAELAKSSREVRQFETEEDRKLGISGPDGQLLLGKDGKPIRQRSPEVAEELTRQIVATDKAVRLMDEVLRLRKQHGWSSDLLQSPEWQKMKSNWNELIVLKKDIAKLGALSESDMDLVTQALGAKDPTGARDPSAGILQARRNAVLGLQGDLRTRRVAEESIPKYPPLADLDSAGRMPGDAERIVALGGGKHEMRNGRKTGKMIMSDEQKKIIEEWKTRLRSDDPAVREQARRDLTNTANNGGIPETREFATAALNSVLSDAPPPSAEDLPVEGRSVARETVPPEPTKKKEEPKKKIKTDSAGNPI